MQQQHSVHRQVLYGGKQFRNSSLHDDLMEHIHPLRGSWINIQEFLQEFLEKFLDGSVRDVII